MPGLRLEGGTWRLRDSDFPEITVPPVETVIQPVPCWKVKVE